VELDWKKNYVGLDEWRRWTGRTVEVDLKRMELDWKNSGVGLEEKYL
jgi:hypothetical protein